MAEIERWSLAALAPAQGYVGAVCVEGSAAEVVCRVWNAAQLVYGGILKRFIL